MPHVKLKDFHLLIHVTNWKSQFLLSLCHLSKKRAWE